MMTKVELAKHWRHWLLYKQLPTEVMEELFSMADKVVDANTEARNAEAIKSKHTVKPT